MVMQFCKKCSTEKPESYFVLYGRRRKACCACVSRQLNEAAKKRRKKPSHAKKLARRRERERQQYETDEAYRLRMLALAAAYSKTDQGKETAKKATSKYKANNPEKVKARSAVNHAIESGRLADPLTLKCAYCGSQAKHYHHRNGYGLERWLDVQPVCTQCHGILG